MKVILYDYWIVINIVKNKIFESLVIGSNIFVVEIMVVLYVLEEFCKKF